MNYSTKLFHNFSTNTVCSLCVKYVVKLITEHEKFYSSIDHQNDRYISAVLN